MRAPRFVVVVVVFHRWVGFPLWLKRNKRKVIRRGCFFDCRFPPLFFVLQRESKQKDEGKWQIYS